MTHQEEIYQDSHLQYLKYSFQCPFLTHFYFSNILTHFSYLPLVNSTVGVGYKCPDSCQTK